MNNSNALLWVLGVVVFVLLGWYFLTTSDINAGDEAAVRGVVANFGAAMKEVPLLGDSAAVGAAMDEAYGGYVVPELIAAWKSTPIGAPGRRTSSPWPDRITITSITEEEDGSYDIRGSVVESSSTGDGGSYPVTLVVERMEEEWLISDFQGYPPASERLGTSTPPL